MRISPRSLLQCTMESTTRTAVPSLRVSLSKGQWHARVQCFNEHFESLENDASKSQIQSHARIDNCRHLLITLGEGTVCRQAHQAMQLY